MPEGPSILILKEQVQQFAGQKILEVSGNAKIGIDRLQGQKIIAIRSWGKHTLICFKTFTVKIHLLMFGSYRVNERKDTQPRLSMKFKNGELNFYTCSIQFIEGSLDEVYDWAADVLSDAWDPKKAKKKLKEVPGMLVCDALLTQDIFAGVGNIIKNEVLFRIRVHPLSTVGALPVKQLDLMIKEARNYSFDFLEWKKAFVLKQRWLAHNKRICPRDNVPFHRAHLGKSHRRTFFCELCQVLYT
jgi:endonuclease-8